MIEDHVLPKYQLRIPPSKKNLYFYLVFGLSCFFQLIVEVAYNCSADSRENNTTSCCGSTHGWWVLSTVTFTKPWFFFQWIEKTKSHHSGCMDHAMKVDQNICKWMVNSILLKPHWRWRQGIFFSLAPQSSSKYARKYFHKWFLTSSVSNSLQVAQPGFDTKVPEWTGRDSPSINMFYPLEKERNHFFPHWLHGKRQCHGNHAWTCPYKEHSSPRCMNPCKLTDGWLS